MKMKRSDMDTKMEDLIQVQRKLEKEFADYHKKYIQRNIRYKLLKLVEDNLEQIVEFRDRWNIPEMGHKTGKECRKWWKNLSPEIKTRKRPVSYYEEECLIYIKRFKEFISDSGTKPEEKKVTTIRHTSLKHVFEYEIYELMADCTIDPFLYPSFEHYLLYNEVNVNFLFNPGFLISIKTVKGRKNKILSEHASIIFSANTRLSDISSLCFPYIKYIQKQLLGYKEDYDRISHNDEEEYHLGPNNIPPQTKETWLVSSGYVRFNERTGSTSKR